MIGVVPYEHAHQPDLPLTLTWIHRAKADQSFWLVPKCQI